MIEKIEAIRRLVGGAITQKYNGDVIYHDGQVAPTEAEIQAKIVELQADFDAKQYQRDRADAYPSWQDQLDKIFHSGINAWKADIPKIKDQYPKP